MLGVPRAHKARYTPATELNSTRSTLLKVDHVAGDKVHHIGNKVHRDKLSNSPRCRFVAKTSNKVEYIGNKVERIRKQLTLLPVLATVDFQHSRPCWIQLCHQCVPGFTSCFITKVHYKVSELASTQLLLDRARPFKFWIKAFFNNKPWPESHSTMPLPGNGSTATAWKFHYNRQL